MTTKITKPASPTLYERLREAATTAVKLHDGAHTCFNVSDSDLAAIERDMLAPLRDENAALRRAGHTLREAAAKAWTNGVSDIEDSAALYDAINVWDATVDPEVAKEFPGILAAAEAAIREDAIAPWRKRVAKLEYEIGEIIADWMVVARTYYAADRAGETQDGNLVLDWSRITRSVDSVAADRQPDGLAAPSPTVTLEVPEGTKEAALAFLADKKKDSLSEVILDALNAGFDPNAEQPTFIPSPTDAAAEGEDRLSALERKVDDLRARLSGTDSKVSGQGNAIAVLLDAKGVQPLSYRHDQLQKIREYAAKTRHDHNSLAQAVMSRIAALERWREGVDQKIAALEKAEQHRVAHNVTAAGMANLVMWINDRLDEMNEGQEQRLDALREPEVTPKPPVVTKAMMEEAAQYLRNVAPETARNIDYGRLQGAFEAALRAGGAKS